MMNDCRAFSSHSVSGSGIRRGIGVVGGFEFEVRVVGKIRWKEGCRMGLQHDA